MGGRNGKNDARKLRGGYKEEDKGVEEEEEVDKEAGGGSCRGSHY